jgi:hypothetical protein
MSTRNKTSAAHPIDEPRLTPRTVAELLHLTPAAVVRLANTGRLHPIRDSVGRRLFTRSDVQAEIDRRERKHAADTENLQKRRVR